jgi:geranylgeranyl diphosphate synthase type II
VTFEGLEKSKEDVIRLSDEAVSELKSLQPDCEFLSELILFLVHRNK